MTFVVEDGSGLTNSTSYTSVATADLYMTDLHPADATWAAASTDDKQNALMDATRYLDLTYGSRWSERRTNQVQVLDWPRTFVEDRDGFSIDADEIPLKLQYAATEMAWRALTETILPDTAVGADRISRKRTKVGPIETETTWSGVKNTTKKYDVVHRLVSEFLMPVGQVFRA